MFLFIYPKIIYIFFLFLLLPLSPFFSCCPCFLHWLAFFLLPSFSFCHLISDCRLLSPLLCSFLSYCLFFLRFHSCLTPPDWFLCLSIFSSNARHSCFSPCCLWNSFILHTDDEASNRKIS